jgi:hypothetical protein
MQDGLGYGNTCSQMIHTVHILQQRPEQGNIVDISLGKNDVRMQAIAIPAAEIVEYGDAMPFFSQAIGQR